MFDHKIPETATVFFAALLASLLLTPLVRHLALKYKKVEKIKDDRWHENPVPLFGGVAIWASWVLVSFFLLNSYPSILIPLVGASMIFFLGLYDDFFHLNPLLKLIGQIIAASAMVKMGITIEVIPYPMISIPLTILWIVGITNAFNLLDNMDGLSGGIAVISSISLFLLSLQNGNVMVSVLSVALVGAALGFLRYNFYPAKIFMGDCGSMFLGFSLSVLAILGTWKHASNLIITMIVPLLVLGVPIFDTVFVSISRKFRGIPVSHGGVDHISHRLVALGMSQNRAVITLYIFSAFLGGIAVYYNKLNPFVLLIGATLLIVGLFCFGLFLGEMEAYAKENLYKGNQDDTLEIGHHGKSLSGISKRRVAEMIMDIILITVSFFASYLIRFEGTIPSVQIYSNMVGLLPWVIILKLILLYSFGVYNSIWRYIGTRDVVDILKALTISPFIVCGFIYFKFEFIDYSKAVFIIDWMFGILLICGFRFSIRIFKDYMMAFRKGKKKTLIIGAGDAGALLLKEIYSNPALGYQVAGFIDDNPMKKKMRINGITVLGSLDSLPSILEGNDIEEALIAIPSASSDTINRISNICLQSGLRCKTISMLNESLEKKID